MYLIDTNVISEARKGRKANPGVLEFFATNANENRMYLAVQTIGEIQQGVEKIRDRGDEVQARTLEAWLNELLREYAEKILAFDEDSAQVWGKLMSLSTQHPIDKQIAAIALVHDLIVVTRNVADFTGTGVRTINPFDAPGIGQGNHM